MWAGLNSTEDRATLPVSAAMVMCSLAELMMVVVPNDTSIFKPFLENAVFMCLERTLGAHQCTDSAVLARIGITMARCGEKLCYEDVTAMHMTESATQRYVCSILLDDQLPCLAHCCQLLRSLCLDNRLSEFNDFFFRGAEVHAPSQLRLVLEQAAATFSAVEAAIHPAEAGSTSLASTVATPSPPPEPAASEPADSTPVAPDDTGSHGTDPGEAAAAAAETSGTAASAASESGTATDAPHVKRLKAVRRYLGLWATEEQLLRAFHLWGERDENNADALCAIRRQVALSEAKFWQQYRYGYVPPATKPLDRQYVRKRDSFAWIGWDCVCMCAFLCVVHMSVSSNVGFSPCHVCVHPSPAARHSMTGGGQSMASVTIFVFEDSVTCSVCDAGRLFSACYYNPSTDTHTCQYCYQTLLEEDRGQLHCIRVSRKLAADEQCIEEPTAEESALAAAKIATALAESAKAAPGAAALNELYESLFPDQPNPSQFSPAQKFHRGGCVLACPCVLLLCPVCC